jgi:hypothetical protein
MMRALALGLAAAAMLDAAPKTAVMAAPATGTPALMAGVYKTRFKNGDVEGETYTSENILEIVPYKQNAAYFRLHLEFYNGHECGISGIADVIADRLVYRGKAPGEDSPCILNLRRRPDGVHIWESSDGACRNSTCGARGGYGFKSDNPADFPAATQRQIRYLPRLLASSEYADAIKEYEARPRSPAAGPAH